LRVIINLDWQGKEVGDMKKIIVLLAILTLALAGTTYATLVSGPRVTYGGLLEADPVGGVRVDTLICVFNPNGFPLRGVNIHVFDKEGVKLYSGPLMDGGLARSFIPKKGWNWITLGMVVPGPNQPVGYAYKFTWVVTWNPPTGTPDRGAVVEVKEIVYPGGVPADYVWENIKNAKIMSEAALGFDGVGYAPQ
jgi:hypothetical protein